MAREAEMRKPERERERASERARERERERARDSETQRTTHIKRERERERERPLRVFSGLSGSRALPIQVPESPGAKRKASGFRDLSLDH